MRHRDQKGHSKTRDEIGVVTVITFNYHLNSLQNRVHKSRIVSSYQKLRELMAYGFSPPGSRGTPPADTVILGSWPPEQWENKLLQL